MKGALWPAVAVMVLVATVPGFAFVKKREPPAQVAPVTVAGIRYEALPFGKARGLGQNGGYIAAVDPISGRELWVAKVYATPQDPGLEGDKQDVFITAIRAARDGRALTIETERGGRYELDLASRRSRPL
jgi:hypothetical protein